MARQISNLFIYPVKSLGGIELTQAQVTPQGLEHDRRWMLVDEKGLFITQRELPQMALLRLKQEAGGFRVQHHQHPQQQILIPFDAMQTQTRQVQVWDDVLDAHLVSSELDTWFSDMLQRKCTLVKMGPASQRPVDPDYAENDDETGFSDGFPVLLIGQASLDDLNKKLKEKLPMNRFRPNIVVSGTRAFAEDDWEIINAGTSILQRVKSCARCVITTTNQDTAERSDEPLRTLATYRSVGNKVLFGQNLLVVQPGLISCGDVVTLED